MSWWFILALFVVLFVACLVLVLALGSESSSTSTRRSAKDRVGFLRHRGHLWTLIGWCEHADLRADESAS